MSNSVKDEPVKSRLDYKDPYAHVRSKMADKTLSPDMKERLISKKNGSYIPFVTTLTVLASLATIYSTTREVSRPVVVTSTTLVDSLPQAVAPKNKEDSGALDVIDKNGTVRGTCALKHTSVDAKISGYIARVTVKQVFHNPYKENIEARYRFPLSSDGAVDDMTMRIGDRVVKGTIKRREEAAAIYQNAKNAGQVAALLDQERSNIFTQSVANLESGKEIEITIKYTETLAYKDGALQFVFPTVVGPRFQPYGDPEGQQAHHSNHLTSLFAGSTWTNTNGQTDRRAGHDISINVSVDAGLPIKKVTSKLHGIIAQQSTPNAAFVTLKQAATIPNRDFVLDIDVAQKNLKTGYLATKKKGEDGFITLMVMPPAKVQPKEIAPRELVFLVDCSGSQAGAPLLKSKETLNYVLDHVNANDTFQIVSFSDNVHTLFEHPETITFSRRLQAKAFIDGITANGGTWMAPAVESVCNAPCDDNRLRIVSFMTDGFVGNDLEVVDTIKKFRGQSRWFSFGVGDSVNRALIDGIAREGGGEADYVLLTSSAEEVGRKFYEKISTPVLTDVTIKSNDIKFLDVYPRAISDVWSEKPLFFKGRYNKAGLGVIHVDGFAQGKPYRQTIKLNLPDNNQSNSAVAQIWARAKIEDLMSQDLAGAQSGAMSASLKEEIVKTALAHNLMSQFTSFVAVDATPVASTLAIPVDVELEMPQGVFHAPAVNYSAAPSAVSFTPNTPASPAVSSVPASSSSVNYSPSPANSGNPVLDKAMASVVGQLNCLSGAACSAGSVEGFSGLSNAASPARWEPPSGVPTVTIGDLLLLPLGFIPASGRIVLVASLVGFALWLLTRTPKKGFESRSRDANVLVGSFVLLAAIVIAIGHFNLINYKF